MPLRRGATTLENAECQLDVVAAQDGGCERHGQVLARAAGSALFEVVASEGGYLMRVMLCGNLSETAGIWGGADPLDSARFPRIPAIAGGVRLVCVTRGQTLETKTRNNDRSPASVGLNGFARRRFRDPQPARPRKVTVALPVPHSGKSRPTF